MSRTSSSRGVYRRNGEVLAIPHKTIPKSYKRNEAVGCDDQSCISVAPVTDDDVDGEVVVPEGHVIAELTESEAALALAIIIIIDRKLFVPKRLAPVAHCLHC